MILLTILLLFFIPLIAIQISINDLKLLSGQYNYKWRISNWISIICACIILASFVVDCLINRCNTIAYVVAGGIISVTWLWLMAKWNTKSPAIGYLLIWFPLAISYCFFSLYDIITFSPFALYGFYYRNCPFGNLFGKRLLLLQHKSLKYPSLKKTNCGSQGHCEMDMLHIPDFSFAGCHLADSLNLEIPVYKVTDEGILPNTGEDVTQKVQLLIDKVGRQNGGRIYFPKGRYLFNMNKAERTFLQINHSNIILEGEVDDKGNPIAELVNCNHTLNGERNPWLSPFFITTGESLQRSNIFWGIQFKKKKNIITRSGSLADPGSDGTILTPKYATIVTKEASKGDSVLKIANAASLRGTKYIVLAMFNNPEGDLIRDILSTDTLRPEWGTAQRAGDEIAPSYQDLLEIKAINEDTQEITLTNPLRRNIALKYHPEIYSVDMLEHICIRNLKISSKWNGLFRHHGFPIYYSVKQSQEMDYGWNGINMKRVAHGIIENVVFKNLTNPLYIMDSRNVTVRNIIFTGYDGHQGIKVYEHACDNLFQNIEFKCHYADMMGGEGNAYGNVFSNVHYTNPYFKPVDFDFHGFSEGPMSPPSYNLFECIYGFTHIKAGGALYNQPACARENVWWNIETEGEKKEDNLFISYSYLPKGKLRQYVSAIRHAMVKAMQKKTLSLSYAREEYHKRLAEMKMTYINPKEHYKLFPKSIVVGTRSKSTVLSPYTDAVEIVCFGDFVAPYSLYSHQRGKCNVK